jgi:plasmid stabilization system protein ParE
MNQKLSELRLQLEAARADLRAIELHLAKGENNAAHRRAQEAIVRLAQLIEVQKSPPRN